MKHVQQFSIILLISVIGELLKTFLPLPVPASVYGLIIMLVALLTGILSWIRSKVRQIFWLRSCR